MRVLSCSLGSYCEGIGRKVLIIGMVLRQAGHDKLLHALIPSAGPYGSGYRLISRPIVFKLYCLITVQRRITQGEQMNLLSKHETRRRLLRGMPDSDMLSSQVTRWFQSPQGEAVLLAEKEAIHTALEKLFGYHILQLGFSEEHSVIEQSPVGHKIIFSPSFRAGSTKAVASNEELPLSSDSIDVVVLHHALDFAANSHRVLREATRVLRPGGHMFVVGFNPYSYWGFWKLFKRKKNMPWRGKFISKGRVSDWLKLLDLHIDSISYGLHFMPVKISRLLIHAQSIENLGNRLHSPLGGAYFIHCIKQAMTVTPIMPKWRTLRARSSVIPATENVRAKIKIH